VFDRRPLGAGGTFQHFVGGHMAKKKKAAKKKKTAKKKK
jgi:hypothetical protein